MDKDEPRTGWASTFTLSDDFEGLGQHGTRISVLNGVNNPASAYAGASWSR